MKENVRPGDEATNSQGIQSEEMATVGVHALRGEAPILLRTRE